MNDPRRLLDLSAVGGLERALLESDEQPGLTNEQRDAMWTATAARLSLMEPAASHLIAANANGSGARALLVKVASVLVVAGGVATVVAFRAQYRAAHGAPLAIPQEPTRALVVQSAQAAATTSAPIEVGSPEEAPASVTAAPLKPPPSMPSKRSHPVPSVRGGDGHADALRGETSVVLHARNALRKGDCAQALQVLNEAESRIKGGALAQEREVLSIEALNCVGSTDLARDRAAAFLRSYPDSADAAAVRRFLR